MKIIDARSGEELKPGTIVHYLDGGFVELVSVESGLLSASAMIKRRYFNPMADKWVEDTVRTPLHVRWTHPKFFLQHVAFIPT